MPTFTKVSALEMLKANGINDVTLSWTRRNQYGETKPYKMWYAYRGDKYLLSGNHLIEVTRVLIECESVPAITPKKATPKNSGRRYFERGTVVFNCEHCGRRARNVTGQYQRRVCGQCDEIGMIQNSISDNNWTGSELVAAETRIEELRTIIRSKGGNPL